MPLLSFTRGLGAGAALLLAASGTLAAQSVGASASARTVESLLQALPDSTRSAARFPFDSTERSNWHFTPVERRGLTLARMSPAARALVDTLLTTGLSARGFATAKAITRHEAILHEIEAVGAPASRRSVRDSSRYYLSVFDSPGSSDVWGWRVEGHHLSVNFTSIGAAHEIVSPMFMGANPARVPSGPHAGLRLLAAEEDLARDLLLMLDAGQRAKAIISDTAYSEMATRNDPKARALSFEGIGADELTGTQQAQLRKLVDLYAGRLSARAQAHARRDIEDGGFGRLRFAWAGGARVGDAHYYRVHGPTVLIEYDNQQSNANHIHTVWRDLRHDFGGDLLSEHYRQHKHTSRGHE